MKKANSVNKTTQQRLVVIVTFFVFSFVCILVRFANFQLKDHKRFLKLRDDQAISSISLKAKRGKICDRNGIILAETVPAISVYINPADTTDINKTAQVLGQLLDISTTDVQKKLNSDRRFVWLRRQMDIGVKEKLNRAKFTSPEREYMKAVGFTTEDKRRYPYNTLACHVLGFAGVDNQGLTGIEYLFDKDLKGRDGFMQVYKDAAGQVISSKIISKRTPVDGSELRLTLNKDIQNIVEDEIARIVFKYAAKESTVIVLNAHNGEVYAMANYPVFDPNHFNNSQPSIYNTNPAVQEEIEGLPITYLIAMAAGIEDQALSGASTTLLTTPWTKSNFVSFVNKTGDKVVKRYLKLFGVGEKSGISLPETNGAYEERHLLDGQSQLTLTPLQITKIIGTIADNGTARPPRILLDDYRSSSEPIRTILSGTAAILRNSLIDYTRRLQDKEVRIEGYEIGGLGYSFLNTANNKRGALFVGFVKETFSQNSIVIVSVVKGDVERSNLKASRLLFRYVTYETLRYFENKNIRLEEKSDRKLKIN